MFARQHSNALELAVFDPRRIEPLLISDSIRENEALAETVKAVIAEGLCQLHFLRRRQHLAVRSQSVEKAVADLGELEAAPPHSRVRKRLRVKTCSHFTQEHADALGHDDAIGSVIDSAEHRARDALA